MEITTSNIIKALVISGFILCALCVIALALEPDTTKINNTNSTPTPTRTQPKPSMAPVSRWCDADGCYTGSPPQPSPTQTRSPIPSTRWCNATGCYDGTPPPRSSPTPTPTPVPSPSVLPSVDECRDGVPQDLLWQYDHDPCVCDIRLQYGLGPHFSVAEACNSNVGWRDDACLCLSNMPLR